MKLRHFLVLLLLLSIIVSRSGFGEEQFWEYTFRPGDTIWKIAEQHTNSVNNWSEIQKINNIEMGPDRRILPGTRIKIPLSMLKHQPTPAIVIALTGDVTLLRADGKSVKPEVGTKLFSGDRITTVKGQNMRLQFADKSELQILPNSEVILDKLSYHKDTGMVDTRARLNRGHVNNWVQKLKPQSRYQIQTPSSITAVRGTQYRLSAESNGQLSRTEVTKGVVAVSLGDSTREVKNGYGLVAEKGKPLGEPIKLLAAPAPGDNLSTTPGDLYVSWSALNGARSYRYQLARDKDFNQIIIDQSTSENNIQLSRLAEGQFYLRLRGIDQNQLEGLNSTRSYLIKALTETDDTFQKVIIPSGLLMLN
jgi:hypothetical protein